MPRPIAAAPLIEEEKRIRAERDEKIGRKHVKRTASKTEEEA